jgi:subtilisin-like proprotein convertase family protein
VIDFNVANNSGPFLVTNPNVASVIWTEGGVATVAWDVAGTTLAPVSCAKVDILLSIDGGFTYPYTLATNVDNDGNHTVLVPVGSATNTARVRVKAANNIFFDISNFNFKIQAPTVPDYIVWDLENEKTVCGGDDAEFTTWLIGLLNYATPINLTATGVPSGATLNFSTNPATAGDTLRITITGTENVATGLYPIQVQFNSGANNKTATYHLTVLSSEPPVVQLEDGDEFSNNPTLRWNAPGGAAHTYQIRVATDPNFSNIIKSATNLTDTFYAVTGLQPLTVYYWQVKAENICAIGEWSKTAAFRTAEYDCTTYTGGTAKTISAGVALTHESTLVINDNKEVLEVAVLDATIQHNKINDISLALKNPAGETVELLPRSCPNLTGTANWTVDFDDAALFSSVNCSNNANTSIKPVQPLGLLSDSTSQGTWKMLITDHAAGNGGTFQTFSLKICTAKTQTNADPILVKNDTLKVAVGKSGKLSEEWLLSTDADNSAAELTYTILKATNKGTIFLNGVALAVGGTFTQADIQNGSVTYKHEGNTSEADGFQFDVNDGVGGWYGTAFFNIQAGQTNGISTEETPLMVYPNPSSDLIAVDFYLNTDQDVNIWVFDVLGRAIKHYTFSNVLAGNSIFELPVHDFVAGNYVVYVQSADFTKSAKILVVH